MRFLIGSFSHESNYFCAHSTCKEDFQRWELFWGQDVLKAHQGKHTVLGGFIDRLNGNEIIGSVSASTPPSGPVDADFYQEIKTGLLKAIGEAKPLDGVLLSLHGAMSLEDRAGILDPEGDIVAAVREVAGPDAPIGVVFDLHSDTTDLLLNNASITLAYNEEPHRDAYERGVEAADLTLRILRKEIHPVAARERAPLFLPAINMATDTGPMHDLHRLRAELEQTPGVIDISIHGGFYGADQPEAGFSVVCWTDDDLELAQKMAHQVALAAWQKREEFLVPVVPIDEAVKRALAAGEPVGLIDEADDPAGGGSCDSVAILRGMLAGGVTAGGISTVKDTDVARRMAEVGEGALLKTTLGAKTDHLHGEPLKVEGRVAKIYRQPIATDPWSGRKYDVGIIGMLDVQGILVVVTEQKLVTENIDIFEVLGIDVTRLQMVGFKGLGLHIRQALAGKIKTFIPVDGVGVTHPDVRKLGPYRRVRRPVWPLDPIS